MQTYTTISTDAAQDDENIEEDLDDDSAIFVFSFVMKDFTVCC